MSDFIEIQKKIKKKIDLWFKRLYVIAFNVYAWYWLYRQVFVRQSDSFEEYLLWGFMTFGMYYFVLDNQDINFKQKRDEQTKGHL